MSTTLGVESSRINIRGIYNKKLNNNNNNRRTIVNTKN